jgi:hypothetical protein
VVSDREGRIGVRRRLAAVFAADVAGDSRLAGRDESGTLLAFRNARKILDTLSGVATRWSCHTHSMPASEGVIEFNPFNASVKIIRVEGVE